MIASILIQSLAPLVLATALYAAAFTIRRIQATLLTCIVIAGAPVILGVVPLPMPEPVRFILGLGLAIFLTARYTEAELFPDSVLIPTVVQLISVFLLPLILSTIF
jgi:hypothetical protein